MRKTIFSLLLLSALCIPALTVQARIIYPASPEVDSHERNRSTDKQHASGSVTIPPPPAAKKRNKVTTSPPPTTSNKKALTTRAPAPISTPIIPVITSPSHQQTLTNFPRQLTVSWSDSKAQKHVIEVYCDYCSSLNKWSGAPDTYTADNYTNNFSEIVLPGDNEYRLRVKAVTSSGAESGWTDYVYFKFRT